MVYIFEDLLLGTKTTIFGEKKLISVSCINCCVPITTLYDLFVFVLFSQRGSQENELENVKKISLWFHSKKLSCATGSISTVSVFIKNEK